MTVTSAQPPGSSPHSRAPGVFQSTLWSRVRMAGGGHGTDARQALEELCQNYWQPIYAFLRRSGHERETAKDLTQGFFAYVCEHDLLQKADPEKGRFRSFLLGSLKFFVSNQQARERALKRGGRISFVPMEDLSALEPATASTPERLFERKWALAVIGRAMDRLAAEYRRAGMADEFEAIQPYLSGDPDDHLSDLAARLGKSHTATRVLMFRLRNRFRRLVRAVVADTVLDEGQVESELRHLEQALREQ